MVSFTVPGFMLTVIWLELLIVGVLPVFHTPAPDPTPHLNCTMLPLWKLLPEMVSSWFVLLAVIAVGLILLTTGAGGVLDAQTFEGTVTEMLLESVVVVDELRARMK